MRRYLISPAAFLLLAGCMDALEEQTKPTGNIVTRRTQEIINYQPKLKQRRKVSKSEIKVDDPILYGAQAYGPALERIMKSHIKHAVDLFHAEHGRYPKDYDEFMEKIIKEGGIELPVLPGGKEYAYDEVNHKLIVLEKEEK